MTYLPVIILLNTVTFWPLPGYAPMRVDQCEAKIATLTAPDAPREKLECWPVQGVPK